jgi:protein tyrosine phosphatase (PTP) superfamily phosphohydrolase (DUF442 family)
MSQLLDAITGVANAAEPLPGLVTGGQPQASHLAALQAAGCEVVLDIRDPMEPQPFEPQAVRALGLEYLNVPVSGATHTDETLARIRTAVQSFAGKRKAFFYCNSGNRVGATLIPYLMLDAKLAEEAAVETAMRCGLRSAELMEWALEYVKREVAKGLRG